MEQYFKLQARLVPELINVAMKRNNILKEIHHSGPIGRRYLAEKLNEPERSIRKELEFFKEMGWVDISAAGAILTNDGKELLDQLVGYIKLITGVSSIEEEVQKILQIPAVYILPTSHSSEYIKRDLGRFAVGELKRIILNRLKVEESVIIAVTGGTTMSEVANAMSASDGPKRPLTVIPGRGGLGENVDIQSNTIAATMARNLGGAYRLLHVPDNLQESTIHSLSREPQIKEVLELLAKASILIHGVGSSREMARRRGMTSEEVAQLDQLGAVGEAFGYYFNEAGETIHITSSIGIKLDDLARDDLFVIAIAEGEDKARAIKSVVSPRNHDVLITDEKTARKIIEIYG